MLRDLRYGIRALTRQRAFSVTATLVLGLAISVNTAVFSLINSLLFRPLPFHAPGDLAFVSDTGAATSEVPYRYLSTAGLVIGLVCSVAALRYASHALVPLPGPDPLTLLGVPAILAAAVLLACCIPAMRAAGIDPNVALRHL